MDLAFQVPTPYCSLQHRILLSSTDNNHISESFPLWSSRFILPGIISSSPPLFPSSLQDTIRPGGLIFWCHIFLSFYTVHEVLTASILGWQAIPSSSGLCFYNFIFLSFFSLGCARYLLLQGLLSARSERGCCLVAVHRLLRAVASPCCGAQALGCTGCSGCGSQAPEHWLSS